MVKLNPFNCLSENSLAKLRYIILGSLLTSVSYLGYDTYSKINSGKKIFSEKHTNLEFSYEEDIFYTNLHSQTVAETANRLSISYDDVSIYYVDYNEKKNISDKDFDLARIEEIIVYSGIEVTVHKFSEINSSTEGLEKSLIFQGADAMYNRYRTLHLLEEQRKKREKDDVRIAYARK